MRAAMNTWHRGGAVALLLGTGVLVAPRPARALAATSGAATSGAAAPGARAGDAFPTVGIQPGGARTAAYGIARAKAHAGAASTAQDWAQDVARDGGPGDSPFTGRVAVVRVPVPRGVRDRAAHAAAVRWRAVAGPGMRLLGADSGTVTAADTLVRLTLQRGTMVRGGRHLGAEVRFTEVGVTQDQAPAVTTLASGVGPRAPLAPARPLGVVRVPLEVPVKRALALRPADAVPSLVRGRWTALPLTVANVGNVLARARVRLALPPGWRVAEPGTWNAVTAQPGTMVTRVARVWVPESTPVGQQVVMLRLLGDGVAGTVHAARQAPVPGAIPAADQPVTEAAVPLRLEVREAPRAAAGPQLSVTTMGVRAGGVGAAGGVLAVAGPLLGTVTVDARVAVGGASTAAPAWGLARSGVVSAPPSLTLASPQGAVTLGPVLGPGTLLSGAFLTGVGGTAQWERPARRVQLLAARPLALSAQRPWGAGAGALVAGTAQQHWGAMRVGVEGAHLRDPAARRALDAAVLTAALPAPGGGVLDAGAGWRRFAVGQGAGVEARYQRTGAVSTVELHLVHAPGGSAAFARAARERSLAASRRFGERASVAANAWQQGDEGGALGRLRSTGFALVPSLALAAGTTRGALELRGATLRSDGVGGVLDQRERQLGLLVTTRLGRTTLGARAALAALRRAVGAESLPLVAAHGVRGEWRATAATTLPGGGRLEGAWTVFGGAGDASPVPRQQGWSARVDRLALPRAPRVPVTLEGETQWLATPGAPPVWLGRAGVRLRLPGGGALTWQVERAPFATAGGRSALVYALRLDQRAAMPPLPARRTRVVFADANDNGRRDPGEGAVPGVLVRCGNATVAADAAGRVRCAADDALDVDPRSLPAGYLVPRRMGPSGRAQAVGREGTRDPLALRPVRPLQVQVVPLDADTFRVRPADLARALLSARDDAGQRWMARPLGEGRFAFDALPPGRYQLEADLLDIPEPLQLAAPLPPVTITAGEPPAPVVITVRARPVRLTPPPTGGAPAPRAGAGGARP